MRFFLDKSGLSRHNTFEKAMMETVVMPQDSVQRAGRVETGGSGRNENHSGAASLNTAVRGDGSLPLH